TDAAASVSQRVDNLPGPKKCTYRAIELTTGATACLIQEAEDADPYGRPSQSNLIVSLGVGRQQDPPDCRGLAELCAELTVLELNQNFLCQSILDDLTSYIIHLESFHLESFLEALCAGIRNPRFEEANIKSLLQSGRYKQSWPALEFLQRCSGNSSSAHPFYRLAQLTSAERTVESLEISELRKRLIEFHERYYSGNLLRISIIVTTFGGIPNRSAPKVDISSRELEDVKVKSGGIKIRGKSMNVDGIHLVFPLPDQSSLSSIAPDLYVKHLLRSKHVGSLEASLNLHGFSLNSARLMDFGQVGFDFFCISVQCNAENNQIEDENMAIKIVFRYLAMIRSVGPLNWLHNELRLTLQREFAPKGKLDESLEPMDPMINLLLHLASDDYSLATRLQRFSQRDALTARHLITEYSAQAIADFLTFLTPDSGKLCCVPEGQQAEYSTEKLSPALLNLCSAPWPKQDCDLDREFKMPHSKPFMPSDISLRPRVSKAQLPGPRQLRIPPMPNSVSSNSRLWFRQDDRFQSDLAYISIDLIPPIECSPKNQIILEILVQLFSKALHKLKKQAAEVCMELSISRSSNGIQLCFSGYNEPLLKLITTALHQIADLKITKESVHKVGSKVLHLADESASKDEEVDQLACQLNLAGYSHMQQKLDGSSLNGVPIKDLMSVASYFCEAAKTVQKQPSKSPKTGAKSAPGLFADILVFGNATADDAVKAAQSILTALPSLSSTAKMTSNPKDQQRRPEHLLSKGSYSTVQLGGAEKCVAVSQSDCYSSTSCVCAILIQIPLAKAKPPISMSAATKALGEEFFTRASHDCLLQMMLAAAVATPSDRIESKISLGYGANCVIFQKIIEQSPAKMEKEIESFIAKIGNHLTAMSSESLETYKQKALQSMQALTVPKSIEQHHSMYWTRIMSRNFEFSWDDPRAMDCLRAIVDSIKKEDLLNYWKGKVIADLEKFKNSLEPAALPIPSCLKTVHDA
uniref:Peptidase_M16_M domain-containing protein n=1 Tax=Macrostomum lignano TaxID=282301 RepID=A0A1I8J8M2_9PLAT